MTFLKVSGWIVLAAALLAAGLYGVYQVGRTAAYAQGYAEGQASAASAAHNADLTRLNSALEAADVLTTQANLASQRLGQSISDRQRADAKSSSVLQELLAATAEQRVACVFAGGVLQQLTDARDRAAAAAAGGLGNAVPGAR